jgi:translation initiation factor 1
MSEICPVCGLPEELCVCENIAREGQEITIYTEKRRYGNKMTVIEGLDDADIDIEGLSKQLKTCCACGGTVKDRRIELQGSHKQKARERLEELGFAVDVE